MMKMYRIINHFPLALSLLCISTIISGCGLRSSTKDILPPVLSGSLSIPHWELAHYNYPITGMALSADGSEGWAIGTEGFVARYDGKTWKVDEKASSLARDTLSAIWLSADGKAGWIVGYGGTVLQLQGGVWRQLRLPEERRGFRSVTSTEQGKKACLVSDHLNLWCYENGTFRLISRNTDYEGELPIQPLPDRIVWGSNQEPAWALLTEWDRNLEHIFARRYKDGQWMPAVKIDSRPWRGSFDSILSVSSAWLASDRSNGWAALSDGTILKYDNGLWSVDRQASTLTQEKILCLAFTTDGSSGWAVGDRGAVLFWDGQQWQVASRQQDVASTPLGAAWLSKDGWGLALTETGSAALTFRDGRWSAQPSLETLTGSDLDSVWCGKDLSNAWAHGWAKDATEILRLTEQGWKVVKTIPNPPRAKTTPYRLYISSTVLSADGSIGWAISSNGGLLHYNGTMWRPWTGIGSDPPIQNVRNLYVSAAGDLGATTTEDGRLFIYRQGRWIEESRPRVLLGGRVRSLWLNKTNLEGWAIGHLGQLLRFQNGQWAENVETPGRGTDIVYVIPTETGEESLAVGSNVEVFRFKQGRWRPTTFGGLGSISGGKPAIWISPDQKYGWIAGGAIPVSALRGGEWVRDHQVDRSYGVRSICLSPDQKSGWAVGVRGLILRYAPKPIGDAEWWPEGEAKQEQLTGSYRLRFKNDLQPGELPKIKLVEHGMESEGMALTSTDCEIRPIQGRPREFRLDFKGGASRLAERQKGVRHKLRIEAHFAHASLPVVGVFETEPVYLQGRPLYQMILFGTIGVISMNLLLFVSAVRWVWIRTVVLHPIGSAVIGLVAGKYLLTDWLIRFALPLKLAMFHDYRKRLAASSVLPWKDRPYVPPQVSLEKTLTGSSKSYRADAWRAVFEEILRQSRGRVWLIMGQSGLGKTALLEKWTELALELGKTPFLIRLHHSMSPTDEVATLMGQFGDVSVKPEVAQDLLTGGGFVLLLDGYNEDRKPEVTREFIRQVARRNLVVMTSQFDPGWSHILDVFRVYLEPFGRDQLCQILSNKWVELVLNSPHLKEISQLPFTAQLLASFIKQKDQLPSNELDIYDDLRAGLDPVTILNLEEAAWELFKVNQAEFSSGPRLPKEFCEAAVSAGILTRRVQNEENAYRFVHERIHRLFVASYLERQDERPLGDWHKEAKSGLGRNYWTDVLDFWGQIKGRLAVRGDEGRQRAYRTFLQGVASFSPPIFAHLHIQYDRLCRSYPQLADQGFSDWAALVLAKAVLEGSPVGNGANIE